MATVANEQNRKPVRPRGPVRQHPAFPAIVALWCATLLGLGTLVLPVPMIEHAVSVSGIAGLVPAAAAPLGLTARALIALAAGGVGALLGLAIGRVSARIAGRNTMRPPIHAHDELGQEGFDGDLVTRKRTLVPASAMGVPVQEESDDEAEDNGETGDEIEDGAEQDQAPQDVEAGPSAVVLPSHDGPFAIDDDALEDQDLEQIGLDDEEPADLSVADALDAPNEPEQEQPEADAGEIADIEGADTAEPVSETPDEPDVEHPDSEVDESADAGDAVGAEPVAAIPEEELSDDGPPFRHSPQFRGKAVDGDGAQSAPDSSASQSDLEAEEAPADADAEADCEAEAEPEPEALALAPLTETAQEDGADAVVPAEESGADIEEETAECSDPATAAGEPPAAPASGNTANEERRETPLEDLALTHLAGRLRSAIDNRRNARADSSAAAPADMAARSPRSADSLEVAPPVDAVEGLANFFGHSGTAAAAHSAQAAKPFASSIGASDEPGGDGDEDIDALTASLSLPLGHLADTHGLPGGEDDLAAPGDEPEAEDDGDDAGDENCGSLLSLRRPSPERRISAADDAAEQVPADDEPENATAAAPRKRRGLQGNPEQTEQALREALLNLQRISSTG